MKRFYLKNFILKSITCAAAGVFCGSGAYLLDPRYIGAGGDAWKVACTTLVGSAVWISAFIWANPKHVERFFERMIGKGECIYGWSKRKIKKSRKRPVRK